jgi:hypothetical protein
MQKLTTMGIDLELLMLIQDHMIEHALFVLLLSVLSPQLALQRMMNEPMISEIIS